MLPPAEMLPHLVPLPLLLLLPMSILPMHGLVTHVMVTHVKPPVCGRAEPRMRATEARALSHTSRQSSGAKQEVSGRALPHMCDT
jgi:hypothetical protein